jgi:gliding motility-associated-like protein
MKAILILLLSAWTFTIYAQNACTGNLGENIFTAGDFGSGAANVVPGNPNIAPGYTYTTNPPPFDGSYVVTNNSAPWPGLFPSWLQVGDNSNDPNGYYMVVNASFDPGLFYEQTIDGLCENTLYVFSVDVLNMIRTNTLDHILPNVSFLIDGVEQFSTGDVPQNEQWNAYGFTFTTNPGQTEVTLALSNSAPGGNGNDLGLDNISFRACGPVAQILPETVERICEDGQFTTLEATITGDQYPNPALQWQQSLDDGLTWQNMPGENGLELVHTELSAGFYYYRYLVANSPGNLSNNRCRIVSNIKVVEVVPKRWNITDTICEGLTYVTGNSAYDQTGIYVDSLISSLGCDSIVTLDLTVDDDPDITAQISTFDPVCVGESGSIQIDTVIGGVPDYIFRILGADSIINGGPSFPGLPPGPYTVFVEDRFGCRFDIDTTIASPREFFLELGADQSIPLGEPARINVIATDSISVYRWTPEIPDCGPDCATPFFFPTNSQVYRLDAVSRLGCPASDSIRIGVQKERRVFLPNAFSPNGDGVNDTFLPFVDEPNVQLIISMRIFNRWGGVVYEAENLAPNATALGWDGMRNEQAAEPGTYLYQVLIGFLDGEVIQYSGDVVLLR